MRDCDVLVAGGGSAGIAAAVSAARLGARTILVERGGALGGQVASSFVHSICGLYLLPEPGTNCSMPIRPVMTNDGFAAEFAKKLCAAGGAATPSRIGNTYVLLHHPFVFSKAADEIARETAGLELLFHAEMIGASSDAREIEIVCRGARETVRAKAVVDATGDAAIVAMAGLPTGQTPPRLLQRPAIIFALSGVDAFAMEPDAKVKLAGRLVSAVQSGALPSGALGASLRGSGRTGEAFVTVDLSGGDFYDPHDANCAAQLESEGRALAHTLARFLREEMPGFSESQISAMPARIGIRESRRLVGRYSLTGEDVQDGARFEDAVARSSWPMELRETNRGARLRYPRENRTCDIPLRSLRALDHDHLFAAGRCISSTHEAQASIRVIGTCFATGEAAGIGAALKALTGECDAPAVLAARERIKR